MRKKKVTSNSLNKRARQAAIQTRSAEFSFRFRRAGVVRGSSGDT